MKHLKDIFNLNLNVYKELIHTYFKNIYNFVIMYDAFFHFYFRFQFFIFKDKILNRPHIRAFALVLFCIHVANLFVYYMILVPFI